MADLTNVLSDNPQEQNQDNLQKSETSWVGGLLNNWINNNPGEKWTLEDGSVILSGWTLMDPETYLLYLAELMIHNKSSDIYFTYWEEPAIRIYWEVHRVMTAPKLEDTTLEAISNILMTEEDQILYNENLSCDLWYSVHGRRYRVNISRQRWHKMIVARLLEEKILTIQELWLPEILRILTKRRVE